MTIPTHTLQISLVISDKARPRGQYVDFIAPCADYSLITLLYQKISFLSSVLPKIPLGQFFISVQKGNDSEICRIFRHTGIVVR